MRSVLDSYADQVIAWRLEGKTYREIAALLKEENGVAISFVAVGNWYRRQALQVKTARGQAALQIQLTRELIETEWAKQIYEFYGNYDAAKKQGQHAEAEYQRALEANQADEAERWDLERHTGPAMAVWGRLWVDAVKTVASKLVPTPTPVRLATEKEGEMTAEEFWERIREERED
ncbi:MAG: hypothetical protein LN413_00410 [Candidatus Thermoplasmatota archaeon]|nr:hypothetical protein [Candidatus Thermoplasmatota archaeon]